MRRVTGSSISASSLPSPGMRPTAWSLEKDLKVDLKGYSSVVLYRLTDIAFTEKLAAQARALSVPVYYDIDDLVFDYDKISYLEFLKGRDYQNFRQMTQQVHRCMELSDGFITSTETLAEELVRNSRKAGHGAEECVQHGDADLIRGGLREPHGRGRNRPHRLFQRLAHA